jgi:hypothetical protein
VTIGQALGIACGLVWLALGLWLTNWVTSRPGARERAARRRDAVRQREAYHDGERTARKF